jgi:hypothetical protein
MVAAPLGAIQSTSRSAPLVLAWARMRSTGRGPYGWTATARVRMASWLPAASTAKNRRLVVVAARVTAPVVASCGLLVVGSLPSVL